MKMHLNAYWAYGLRIQAELQCPELPADAQAEGKADVTIRLLPASGAAMEALENGYYEVHPGVFRLAVPGVAQYRVEEGRLITVEPATDAAPERLRLFLLGSAMGALLYQRGLFPLHGSAVETPWGGMIFVGPQGVGKSTLAAQFHRRGFRLLSDDVCAVEATELGLRILPAVARFRLCADAFELIGSPEGGHFDVDKYVVPMGEGYCPDPAPLKAIAILAYHEDAEPEFRILRGFDRVQRLLENLYRPHYLKGQQTQGELMRMAGLIAEKTTMAIVSRRRNAAEGPALVEFLQGAWAERFGRVVEEEKS